MPYSRKQKIKRKDKHANALENKQSIKTIADNAALSSNARIAAAGAAASGKAVTLGTSITGKENAQIAAKTAVRKVNTDNGKAVDSYDALATIIEQESPNDPDGWIELGCEVTEDTAHSATKPGIVLHGSVSQSDTLGKADVHHDPLVGVGFDYVVLVTKADPTNRALYIDVTNEEESTSSSSTTVTLPADYLGVTLFFILYAHNTAGKGPDSTPFGGRKFQ